MEVKKLKWLLVCPLCVPILWPGVLGYMAYIQEINMNKLEAKCRNLNGIPVYYDRKVMTCVSAKTGIPIDIKD